MKPLAYRTLLRLGEDEIIINKSRFIGHARPVSDEAGALDFLREMREKYRDASHNCYAYIVGTNEGIMRYNDDGEPSGTAGMPILHVLREQKLVDLAVVVTRYFGGVLLGAGGLVRAYTQGAVIAVKAAGIAVMRLTKRGMLEVPYPLWDRLRHFLEGSAYLIEEVTYLDAVLVTLLVRSEQEAQCLEDMLRISDGKIEPLWMDEEYLPWPEREGEEN